MVSIEGFVGKTIEMVDHLEIVYSPRNGDQANI